MNPRLLAAAVIAIAFFLLQYSCTRPRPLPSSEASTRANPVSVEAEEDHYAWEDVSPSDPSSWLSVAVFAWPLLAVLWRNEPERWWGFRILVEGLGVGYSSFFIYMVSDIGRRRVGAYLALAGLALYTITLLAETRRRLVVRHLGGPAGPHVETGRRTMQ